MFLNIIAETGLAYHSNVRRANPKQKALRQMVFGVLLSLICIIQSVFLFLSPSNANRNEKNLSAYASGHCDADGWLCHRSEQ